MKPETSNLKGTQRHSVVGGCQKIRFISFAPPPEELCIEYLRDCGCNEKGFRAFAENRERGVEFFQLLFASKRIP